MRACKGQSQYIGLYTDSGLHDADMGGGVRSGIESDGQQHHVLKVAGREFDTKKMPGMLDQHWTRRLLLNIGLDEPKQWYAVFKVGVNVDKVAKDTGVAIASYYIPNNARIFTAKEVDALKVASHRLVEWVGVRQPEHKVAAHLDSSLASLRQLHDNDGEAGEWVLWSEEFHRDLEVCMSYACTHVLEVRVGVTYTYMLGLV